MKKNKNNVLIGAIISFLSVMSLFLLPTNAQAGVIPKGSEYVYGTVNKSGDKVYNENYMFWYKVDENDLVTKNYTPIKTTSGVNATFTDMNALAVRDDGFYVKSNTGTEMAHIDWDGIVRSTWTVAGLKDSARSGAFAADGRYITTSDYASSGGNAGLNLYLYNIDTKAISKILMKNSTSIPNSQIQQEFNAMGDIAADDNGFLYAVVSSNVNLANPTRRVYMLKIKLTTIGNVDNAEIVDILPIPKLDHAPSIAFMSDGRLLISDIKDVGAIVDFEDGTVIDKDKFGVPLPKMGGSQTSATDFASLNYPEYHTTLGITAKAPATANYRQDFEYKLTVRNTGNIMSLQTKVKETIDPRLEYVPNSTAVNGVPVPDTEGTSPILKDGLMVHSPFSDTAVLVAPEGMPSLFDAVATFKVRAREDNDFSKPMDDLKHVGMVMNPDEMVVSNLEKTVIGPYLSAVTANFIDDTNSPIVLDGVDSIVKPYFTGEKPDLRKDDDIKRVIDLILASGKYEAEVKHPDSEDSVLIDKDGTEVSYMFTRSKWKINVNFLTETGRKIDEVVIERPVDTLVNIGKNQEVIDMIAKLESEHYVLLTRPSPEEITIGMQDISIDYVFKETLGSITATFVDEVGKAISDPITIKGVIESEVILTENEDIQKTLADLKGKHYELVEEAPAKVTIEATPKTIPYKFKGNLYIESFPTRLNFRETTTSGKKFIKVEQPKYDVPLVIGDTRNSKTPWTLTATLEKPLTSEESPSEVLKRALWYKKSDSSKEMLYEHEALPIEIGIVSETGEYNVSSNWDNKTSGLEVNVYANEIIEKGDYKATILWQVGTTP